MFRYNFSIITIAAALIAILSNAPARAAYVDLPASIRAAINTAFPQATIESATVGTEGGLRIYRTVLNQNGATLNVSIASGGIITTVATPLRQADLPFAVSIPITTAAGGADVTNASRVVERAAVGNGEAVPLDRWKTYYQADLTQNGQQATIKVAPNGVVLQAPNWTTTNQ
jgi:hypothetical protein